MKKVRIDIEAEFIDNASKNAKKLDKNLKDLQKNSGKKIGIDIDDKASSKAKGLMDKVKNLKNAKGIKIAASVSDKATSGLKKIGNTAKGLAKRAIKIPVSIIDKATKPLRGIFNYATSLKGIMTGILTGAAVKQGIMNPIAKADEIEKSLIGFENILGDKGKANQLMGKIQKFAAETSFDNMGVIESSRDLLRYNISTTESLFKDLTAIGDAVSTMGGGTEEVKGITLAFSQMAAKGKISSEELNQMAERGIQAKKYLQEAFNTDGEGLEKMLRKGSISADEGIKAIMDGLKTDTKIVGSMAAMANRTFGGLGDQIKETFDNKILMRWGQGLSEGTKPHLQKFLSYLDKNEDKINKVGDSLQRIGTNIADGAFNFIEERAGRVKETLASSEFQQGSLTQKVGLLWDATLGEPISEWWNSTGSSAASSAAKKAGKLFVDGIADGIKSIGKGIFGDIGESFKKVLPGGEEASTGDYLTTALAGYGIFKGGKGLFNKGKSLFEFGKGLFGKGTSTDSVGGLGGLGTMTMTAGVVNLSAGSINNGGVDKPGKQIVDKNGNPLTKKPKGGKAPAETTKPSLWSKISTGLSGFAAKGGSAATGKAATVLGGAGVLGAIGTAGGLISGVKDLYKGFKNKDSNKKWSGGTKLGMVGAGVGIGAGIGSVVPVVGTGIGALVGGGIAGIGAMFKGNSIGSWLQEKVPAGINKIKDFGSGIKNKVTGFFGGGESKSSNSSSKTESKGINQFDKGLSIVNPLLAQTGMGVASFNTGMNGLKTNTASLGMNTSLAGTAMAGVGANTTIAGSAMGIMGTNSLMAGTDVQGMGNSALMASPGILGAGQAGLFAQPGLIGVGSAASGSMGSLFALAGAASSAAGALAGIGGRINSAIAGAMAGAGIPRHAEGGIVKRPHVGMVGEAGQEAIIPLTDRKRGMDVWQQAGKMLGVSGYSDGGMVGKPALAFAGTNSNINTEINFNINSSDGDIIEQIKSNSNLIADIIMQQINRVVKATGPNMRNQ